MVHMVQLSVAKDYPAPFSSSAPYRMIDTTDQLNRIPN
jgi:hypothetical protein